MGGCVIEHEAKRILDQGRMEGISIGRNEGISIGEKRGISIGRNEGISIGRNEGISIGRNEGIQSALDALIREGYITPEIAKSITIKER